MVTFLTFLTFLTFITFLTCFTYLTPLPYFPFHLLSPPVHCASYANHLYDPRNRIL